MESLAMSSRKKEQNQGYHNPGWDSNGNPVGIQLPDRNSSQEVKCQWWNPSQVMRNPRFRGVINENPTFRRCERTRLLKIPRLKHRIPTHPLQNPTSRWRYRKSHFKMVLPWYTRIQPSSHGIWPRPTSRNNDGSRSTKNSRKTTGLCIRT